MCIYKAQAEKYSVSEPVLEFPDPQILKRYIGCAGGGILKEHAFQCDLAAAEGGIADVDHVLLIDVNVKIAIAGDNRKGIGLTLAGVDRRTFLVVELLPF